ncbi:MAG: hypothetical protein R8K49_07095 [Mariprofundaceae bacterium]
MPIKSKAALIAKGCFFYKALINVTIQHNRKIAVAVQIAAYFSVGKAKKRSLLL